LHIISIVPINAKLGWGVTLTIDAETDKAITPIIHTEGHSTDAVRRAMLLYRGLQSSGGLTIKVATDNAGIRSGLWDALYADGNLNPDENISAEIPQGAHDAIALMGGAA
jgi:hypothetical protein